MKKSAYIIAYTYESTDDWIGSFPSTINQWFVMQGNIPMTFFTREEAQEYCKDNALTRPCIIPIAGSEASYFTPVYSWEQE